MLRIALRGAWHHRRRLLGNGLAVVLGVAFLAGTLVLSDTLRGGGRRALTTANAGTDVVVRGSATGGDGGTPRDALVSTDLVGAIRTLEGVRAAEAEIEAVAQVLGDDGRAVGGGGAPTLGVSWIEDGDLSPYELVEGRPPEAPGEVAVDRGAADAGGLVVGDSTTVRTPEPVAVTVVGVFEVAGGTPGGATLTAFEFGEAQTKLLDRPGLATRVRVAGTGDVTQETLAGRVADVLPAGTEAVTGTAFTEEAIAQLGRDLLDAVALFLSVFVGIALLVATFSIYNTFSITVAQRLRESALLRALGASRRQVLASVLVEALVTGAFASALGVLLGSGIAVGLRSLLGALGVDLEGPLVLRGQTVGVALAVGAGVTVVASAAPAVRAGRVAPLAAIRAAAVDGSDGSRWRAITGAALAVIGVGAALAVPSAAEDALVVAGVAAALTAAGTVTLGPVLIRPVSFVVGGIARRLRGVTGQLAQRNVQRSPRRTAGTAAALLVGVGIVTVFACVASSLSATITDTVDRSFGGDLVVQGTGFTGSGLSPRLAADLDTLPEVAEAVGIGFGDGLLDGDEARLTIADPAGLDALLEIPVVAGSVAALAGDGVAVDADEADERGLALGDTVSLGTVAGSRLPVTVAALYEGGQPGDALGSVLVPEAIWAPEVVQFGHVRVLVALADGTTLEAGRAAVETAGAPHGHPVVLDRDDYTAVAVADGGISELLPVVYALLGLSIVIALMGIANTLALSVHERTREIGLIRALGQTRSQLRAVIRWESVIVALFGTIVGAGLGTFIGWTSVRGLTAQEGFGVFALPGPQLLGVVLTGVVVGVVAAVQPARRAARLEVLTAIAAD
jgi:putative ABC transport system permease protein